MGFFSKIFTASKTGANASEDAVIAEKAQTEKIEALLESVNSASQHVRNYYITFLLAGFYVALIIWSTTDLMLLKDTPVTMPLLNVELPITGFYTFAPYFFLLLHFNLLLQFSLLADKVHRFDQAVMELQNGDSRCYYYTRLFAFAFTQTLSDRHHSRLLHFLLTLLVWISAIWLPLGILIGLQVGFLAYHSEEVLFWQRVAVMLDLLVLWIFWPIIRATDSRWSSWIRQASGLPWLMKKIRSICERMRQGAVEQFATAMQSKEQINHANDYLLLEGGVSIFTSLAVIVFVWGVAVLPDSKHEIWVARNIIPANWKTGCSLNSANKDGERYFQLTEFLFDGRKSVISKDKDGEDKKCEIKMTSNIFNRNLIIREQLLIANELKAEDEADLTHTDEVIRKTALKKITGLVLSGRDLRYADFSEARLPKVDFWGANKEPSDLRYANFRSAMLVEARMFKTLLQGAYLSFAQLQGANLSLAQLQGANLSLAQLQGADLIEAQLQEADLRGVELQGTNLQSAELQGANLSLAQLQGAGLIEAKLWKADLKGVGLQGANLQSAELQGANLSLAQLQGADLQGAKLERANFAGAQLQGADLRGTFNHGTDLWGTYFSYFDITSSELGFLTQQILESMQKRLTESIRDEELLKRISDILVLRKEQSYQDIWGIQLDQTRLYSFWNRGDTAVNESAYQNKLVAYLIELSCQDRWMAGGIIRNRIGGSVFGKPISLASGAAQCLLSLKDHRSKAKQLVCPAMSEIGKATVEILERAAAGENPDSSIQPTFACQTSLSD